MISVVCGIIIIWNYNAELAAVIISVWRQNKTFASWLRKYVLHQHGVMVWCYVVWLVWLTGSEIPGKQRCSYKTPVFSVHTS